MRFLQDLQDWMTDQGIGVLQHWLADSLRDPTGLNELLVVYGQFLWKALAPYRKFSETVNAISMLQPLVRRQLGLCWDLGYMWMSKEPHEHRTAIPALVHSALCARGLSWGWPRVVALLCASRCGLMRPGEFLLATRRQLVLPRDVGYTVPFAQFVITDPKTRYVAAKIQSARVDAPDIVALLDAVYGDRPRDELLWPASPATFRARFNRLVVSFGLFAGSGGWNPAWRKDPWA